MHTITRATLGDAQLLLELQRRAFIEEGRRSGSYDIPPLIETLASVAEHILHQTALVAVEDGRIIGAVRGIVSGNTCTIRALVVEPVHQGHGIGSLLLKTLEDSLPRVARFELTTNTVMEGNVPFYDRHGYRVTELTRYSERVTLAQMSKAIMRDA
jgi:GNAT superfamily N-acetyltransferase